MPKKLANARYAMITSKSTDFITITPTHGGFSKLTCIMNRSFIGMTVNQEVFKNRILTRKIM